MDKEKRKRWKSVKTKILCFSAVIIVFLGVIAMLFYNGIVLFNNPSKERYPVRGVDVSAYQGDIDWEALAQEGIQFAFIKATEGSTFIDKKFKRNYENARKTNVRIGAYHFFSFDSSGETQATSS